MTRSPRPRTKLSDSLQRQLNMYALAAGAAGVGALALAPPAEARIVYTPAHVQVGPESSYCFSLDHEKSTQECLYRNAHYSNTYVMAFAFSVAVTRTNRSFELAIFPGARIGPARRFIHDPLNLMADGATSSSLIPKWRGPWANDGKGVKNRYLGLRFKDVDGNFHYGWARVTVAIDNPKINSISQVLLTGYAYETIPNKPITAGATKDANDVEPTASLSAPAPEPATLGILALGAPALSIWRREETISAQ